MSCRPAKAAFSFCKRYEQMSEFAGPFMVIDITRMQKFRGLCCQFLVFNELASTHFSIVNFLYGSNGTNLQQQNSHQHALVH